MNEIRMSAGQTYGPQTNAATTGDNSRKNTVSSQQPSSAEVAKVIAEQDAKAAAANSNVGNAVAELNSYVQSEKRDLFFSVEDKSGETIVRVVDRESGELIRQIPNQVVLDLAASVKQNEPLQLINMQG